MGVPAIFAAKTAYRLEWKMCACRMSILKSLKKLRNLLTNSICPWGILAATIANALTGKGIELNPSEFNEIGALTKLKIVE